MDGKKNPRGGSDGSARGEESVKVDNGKSAMDKQTETEPVQEDYFGRTPEYYEQLTKHSREMEADREAVLARFDKLCQSNIIIGGNSAGDRGNSAAATAKKNTAAEKEMAEEAESFDLHRRAWQSKHGETCGLFSQTTTLSSMQFTHYTPGLTPCTRFCSTPETLQIFSIKLARLGGGLKFPLSVHGTVAVRDTVDRNRNILFSRSCSDCQEVKQNDPFLHLIGPSRAIVFDEKVCIEIELQVLAGSQNKALISCARRYSGGYIGVHNICFKNRFCTLEVSTQPVKQTVQATIVGVQVDHKSWPFEYGGMVACSPLSGKIVMTDGRISRNIDSSSSPPIVLVHSKREAVPKGEDGFVNLSRQVVSVEYEGRLDFDIKSYSKTGAIVAQVSARFVPRVSNISHRTCYLGGAEVTITVAWSRVGTCKRGVALETCARRCR